MSATISKVKDVQKSRSLQAFNGNRVAEQLAGRERGRDRVLLAREALAVANGTARAALSHGQYGTGGPTAYGMAALGRTGQHSLPLALFLYARVARRVVHQPAKEFSPAHSSLRADRAGGCAR